MGWYGAVYEAVYGAVRAGTVWYGARYRRAGTDGVYIVDTELYGVVLAFPAWGRQLYN